MIRVKVKYFMDYMQEPKWYFYTPSSITNQLPLQLYNIGHIKVGSRFFTEREHERTYQIIYTISGSGVMKYKDKTFMLAKNHALLINCNNYHYYSTGPEGIWEYKWAHFKGPACAGFYRIINQNGVTPITVFDVSEINYCFDKAIKLVEDKTLDIDIKISSILMRMLTEIYINRNNTPGNKKFETHKGLIDESIRFIENNYKDNLLIKDIARMHNFNECYFSRLFKKFTGLCPREYVIRVRIDRSKHLLKNSTLSIGEIALEVGFENVNNFIRDFKKYAGTTPLKFRLHAFL